MKKKLLLSIFLSFPLLALCQIVSIGDILCTDGSTVKPEQFASSDKTADGIVFHVDATDSSGWAVALNNQSSSIQWCTYYSYDIPNLPNISNARVAMHDLNGHSNTGIIRTEGNEQLFPAAWAVDYDNGWYLPSAGQLRYLYSYAPEINASLQVVGGTALPYQSNNYWWSSTEISPYHTFDMNTGGSLGDYLKDNSNNYPPSGIAVRQIRDFQIQQTVHQTYHIGDLITNDDGSQGILFYVNPDQTDGWMVALNDVSTSIPWGNESDVPGLTNQTYASPYGKLLDETNGFANTEIIRNHQSGMTTAANAVDFAHGWYLPTGGQLLKLFGSLAFIENKLQTYGNTLAEDFYWSSSEADGSQAFALSCAPMANVRAGHCVRTAKTNHFRVRAVRNIQPGMNSPIVGNITTPESICSGTSLELTTPQIQFASNQGWQINPTLDFSNPIPYNGEPLDSSYNGWYLRYFAANEVGIAYSNAVSIIIWPQHSTSFNITSCTPYSWNGITYSESGIYEQTFTSAQGCDSIVILDLTIRASSYVSPIFGETIIHYQTNGQFTYTIDPVEGCFGYEWSISNGWTINYSPDAPECTVNINSPGTATLIVRVYTECGVVERDLFINHDARPYIVIYPNPTQGDFKIGLYGMQGEAAIVIYDQLGQFLGRFSVDTDLEGTLVPYSLKEKAAGVYMVVVFNRFDVFSKKLVKSEAADCGLDYWWK